MGKGLGTTASGRLSLAEAMLPFGKAHVFDALCQVLVISKSLV